MKTTIEKEVKDRLLPTGSTLESIAIDSTLLPLKVINDNNETVEVTFCEHISGGANEIHNMPKTLSLTRLKMIDGELHSFTAQYTIFTTDYKNSN